MKPLTSILLLIPLVIACRSSVGIDDAQTDNGANTIGFCAIVHTRAIAENDLSDVQANGFETWGGHQNETVFDGTHVTYSNSTWGYDDTKYWTHNNIYNFYAVYPADTPASYNATTGEFNIADYNIKTKKDVDLLIGSVEDHQYPDDGPTVSINFQHALTQISFSAKKDAGASEVTVKEVELYGVPHIGSYTSQTHSWTHVNGNYTTVSEPFAEKKTETELGTTAKDVFGETLLMFPNTHIPTTYTLLVKYTASGQESTSTMLLSSASLHRWEAGFRYNYTFTIIDTESIIFDAPKVTPWKESNGNVIIVE